MIETFAALLLAHVLADFVLQPARMVAGKARPLWLVAHGGVVLGTAWLATGLPTGIWALSLAALALTHIAIDLAKALHPARAGAPAFLADQGAHLVSIAVTAALVPTLWTSGLWHNQHWLPAAMVLVAGALIATRAGGFAVGALMRRFEGIKLPRALPQGGRLIGLLERGLIWILILAGQPGGVGFLIAAKSVLRFDTTSRDQRAGEYVIIGTLASFGWAIAAGYGTLWLLAHLPPIGIPVPAP